MIHQDSIAFDTSGHGHMTNLTARVQAVVAAPKIKTGVAHVFAVGSTAAIGVIEFEPGLQKDLPETLDRLMPPSRAYGHEQTWHDGNGHSHVQATMLGQGLTVPVGGGKLLLGTWQQVILLECDTRARERTVVVTVMGE